MVDYRLYLLNSGNHIERAIALSCEDDPQAMAEMAQHARNAVGAELWQGRRMVHRSSPFPPPESSENTCFSFLENARHRPSFLAR